YKRALDGAEVQSSYQAGPSKASGPVVSAFTSDSPKVSVGSSTKLTWDITDATSLTLDNGIGDVSGKVEFTVSPSQTTTYNLTAANSAGTVTIPFTIVVDNSGDPDADSDGDGWTDGEEAILGTDPQDPSDAFDIQMSLGNADIELRWMSVSGRTYTVESSNDLNSWTQAITIGGDGTEKSYSTSTTDELRFFRLVIE
ncbi:MAG: thrombospondin type 3 repeat-containing protein, partial [Opitutae bacterium]